MVNKTFYNNLVNELTNKGVRLVAVSKTKSVEEIKELYDLGQRIFGENKVQELLAKKPLLPDDIEWHLIGTLQTNKVKQIISHVSLIHSVSSISLLQEIEKRSESLGITSNILLQIHIAQEETKHGFSYEELAKLFESGALQKLTHTKIRGLMGMASFTDDVEIVKNEFSGLKHLFDTLKATHFPQAEFNVLSMGMSGDYQLAIECGANMVRIGSLLFGARN